MDRAVASSRHQRARSLIDEALTVAYGAKGGPEHVERLLGDSGKPGKVCCVFFSGRSGSFFAQSFFDNYCHPQVLTIHPVALHAYESVVTSQLLAQYNGRRDLTARGVEDWCATLIEGFPHLFTEIPSQPGFTALCAPKDVFVKFVSAQLLLAAEIDQTQESLLKIFLISYRLSRGGPLDCTRPLVFIWQAHMPSAARKRWIKQTFKEHLLLTVVRFPEKALDSHLMHHAFETILPPTTSLFRRLFFMHMAIDNELLDVPTDGTEYAIRFEDLHHHTEHVLRALCAVLAVPFYPELCQTSFSMQVLGKSVAGARKLTPEEFQCKLMNYYDRLKVRFLLQEEYRAWGYDVDCEHGLDASLAAYRKDRVAQIVPFAAQTLLTQLDDAEDAWFSMDPVRQAARFPGARPLHDENRRQRDIFEAERARRDRGIHVTPLLYSLDGLSPA